MPKRGSPEGSGLGPATALFRDRILGYGEKGLALTVGGKKGSFTKSRLSGVESSASAEQHRRRKEQKGNKKVLGRTFMTSLSETRISRIKKLKRKGSSPS